MGYNDLKHLINYRELNLYPKIHQAVIRMIKLHANEHEPFIDLGGCYGLLSAAAMAAGRSSGIVIESNKTYFDSIPATLTKVRMKVTKESIPELSDLVRENKVTLLIARRVFPEINEGSSGAVRILAKEMFDSGIEKIVLEGRKRTKTPRNSLFSWEQEVRELQEYFKLICRDGDVCYLERRKIEKQNS